MSKDPLALVWIDLETTGIDDRTSHILEIASIITDKDLNLIAEGPDLVIHQPDEVLGNMDPWCIDQHGRSGLTDASRNAGVPLGVAEAETLRFVQGYCLRNMAPLCGNSVGFDRRFLMHHMPSLNNYLDYRNVDVSSIQELVRRWFPKAIAEIEKTATHRALDDIRESIEELRIYRQRVFREAS